MGADLIGVRLDTDGFRIPHDKVDRLHIGGPRYWSKLHHIGVRRPRRT